MSLEVEPRINNLEQIVLPFVNAAGRRYAFNAINQDNLNDLKNYYNAHEDPDFLKFDYLEEFSTYRRKFNLTNDSYCNYSTLPFSLALGIHRSLPHNRDNHPFNGDDILNTYDSYMNNSWSIMMRSALSRQENKEFTAKQRTRSALIGAFAVTMVRIGGFNNEVNAAFKFVKDNKLASRKDLRIVSDLGKVIAHIN